MIDSFGKTDFDRNQLESANESFKINEELIVQRLELTTKTYGFLYITDKNVYFREINIITNNQAKRVAIRKITKVLKRRFALKYTALEFETESESFYFNFKEEPFRDKFYDELLPLLDPSCLTEKSLFKLTELWVSRQMSNYDYLIDINMLA